MDENVKKVMEMFGTMSHGDQVEFFLAIKQGLLCQRAERIQQHQKEQEYQAENVKALHAGNDVILGNNLPATKAAL